MSESDSSHTDDDERIHDVHHPVDVFWRGSDYRSVGKRRIKNTRRGWFRKKKPINRVYPVDLESRGSHPDVAAETIQRAFRTHLAKRAMGRARIDKEIVFNRETVSRAVSDSINAYYEQLFFIPSLVVVVLFLLSFDLLRASESHYELGGNLKDMVWTREFVANTAGPDVASWSNFQQMIYTNYFDQLEIDTTCTAGACDYVYHIGPYHIISHLIGQRRGKTFSCSESGHHVDGLGTYNSNYCYRGLSYGVDTTTYSYQGKTLTYSTDDIDTTLSTSALATIIRSSSSECMMHKTNDDLIRKTDSFAIPIPKNMGTTDLTNLLTYFDRCAWFDLATREVWLEVLASCFQPEPVMIVMWIIYYIDVNGLWEAEYVIIVGDLMKAEESPQPSRVAGLSLMIINIIFIFVAVMYNLCEFGAGFAISDWRFMRKYLGSLSTWLSTLSYISMILAYSFLFDAEASVQSLINSSGAFDGSDNRVPIVNFVDSQLIATNMRAIANFFTVVKLLQYMQHKGMLSMLFQTLYLTASNMLHFFFTLGTIFVGLVFFVHHLYGGRIYDFRNFTQTFYAVFRLCFGDFDYESMYWTDSLWVPVVLFIGLVLISVILLNFFIAVVLDGYLALAERRRYNTTAAAELAFYGVYMRDIMWKGCVSLEEISLILNNKHLLGRKDEVSLLDLRVFAHGELPWEFLTILYDEGGRKNLDSLFGGPYPAAFTKPTLKFRKLKYRRLRPFFALCMIPCFRLADTWCYRLYRLQYAKFAYEHLRQRVYVKSGDNSTTRTSLQIMKMEPRDIKRIMVMRAQEAKQLGNFADVGKADHNQPRSRSQSRPQSSRSRARSPQSAEQDQFVMMNEMESLRGAIEHLARKPPGVETNESIRLAERIVSTGRDYMDQDQCSQGGAMSMDENDGDEDGSHSNDITTGFNFTPKILTPKSPKTDVEEFSLVGTPKITNVLALPTDIVPTPPGNNLISQRSQKTHRSQQSVVSSAMPAAGPLITSSEGDNTPAPIVSPSLNRSTLPGRVERAPSVMLESNDPKPTKGPPPPPPKKKTKEDDDSSAVAQSDSQKPSDEESKSLKGA